MLLPIVIYNIWLPLTQNGTVNFAELYCKKTNKYYCFSLSF